MVGSLGGIKGEMDDMRAQLAALQNSAGGMTNNLQSEMAQMRD